MPWRFEKLLLPRAIFLKRRATRDLAFRQIICALVEVPVDLWSKRNAHSKT
jgi:hypothetical protein